MPTEHERWASYFYPETYDSGSMQGTLRNLLGERDAAVLAAIEHAEVQDRQRELLSSEAGVPRSYDAAHVRAIHRHLFQDIYAWAGEYRTVNIFKGTPVGFADVESGQIDRYLGDVGRLVTAAPWAELTREEFAERAGTVFAYLNQAHPFREGNGRTSKVFMEHVAKQSRYTLDYGRVAPQVWNEASRWSGPDLGAYEPQPGDLVALFRTISVERSRSNDSGMTPELEKTRAIYLAGRGRPVTDAVRPRRSPVSAPYRRPPSEPGQTQGGQELS